MRRSLHKSVEKFSFLVIKKEMLHVYRTMRYFFGSLLIFFDIWAQKVVFDVTCIIIKPSMRLGCILIDECLDECIKRDTENSKSINTAQTWIFSRNYSYNPSFRTINFSDDQNFYSIW